MTHSFVEAIYAIRHKATGQFVRANGKGCWLSKSAAQSSWNNDGWINGQEKFSEQDECEIVDMLELLLDEQLGRKFDCDILSSVLEEKQEELEEWLHTNKMDEVQRNNDWLLERARKAEQQVIQLEDRLRAALDYPMDKRR